LVNKFSISGRIIFLLSLVLVLLSGCGGGNTGAGDTGPITDPAGKGNATAPQISNEPVTIRMFQLNTAITDEQFNDFFVEPVKKKHPNITMELIRGTLPKASEMISAGEFPDMIFTGIGSIPTFQELGLATDLNPSIKKFNFDISPFEPDIIKQFKVYSDKDQLYAIPFLDNFSALFYDKDIFDRLGTAYPKDSMTWDDAITLAQQVANKSAGAIVPLCPGNFSGQFATVMSLPVVDPATKKAVLQTESWKMLVDKFTAVHKIANGGCKGAGPEGTDFRAGKIAMIAANGGFMTDSEELLNQGKTQNWDIATYPQFKEAPGKRRRMDVTLLMTSAVTKYPDQVFQIIQTVSEREEQVKRTRLGRLSTFKDPGMKKDYAVDLKIAKGKNIAGIFKTSSSAVPPYTPYNGPANKAVDNAVKEVLKGTDINSALRTAEEQANQDIAALIQSGQ
jgi:multiple sugar transport system substrate-binding protein